MVGWSIDKETGSSPNARVEAAEMTIDFFRRIIATKLGKVGVEQTLVAEAPPHAQKDHRDASRAVTW